MKKQKVFNRISSLVLAVIMVLGLCLSPAVTQQVSAGAGDDIAASVKIVATQDNLTFDEGKVGDISSYFTVADIVYLYGNDTTNYYSDTDDRYEALYKTLKVSYYKVAADGSETALGSAPTTAGTYKAYATFAESSYWAYDAERACLGYFYTDDVEGKGSLSYTITGGASEDTSTDTSEDTSTDTSTDTSVDVSEDVDSDNLKLVYGDEKLADEDAFILLMFGDGFTASEQSTFYAESQKIADYIMNTSPYDEFADSIKIYAYGTVSNESGARADKATTQAEADKDTRDTYFGTTFWSGGMQRLLFLDDEGLAKVYALQKEVLPSADFNVIVVNSDTYGGSGGEVCLASLNYMSYEMMLHELGHTIADLADEYWAGAIYATDDKANMTSESDPEKVKWARFVGKNGIGVYKHNQTETSTDWYRPSENCKMQYLSVDSPFCEVCKEELRKAFSKYSNVTKLFFQPYADEFYESATGKDMSEYFILRRNGQEITGDQLGSKLKLVYKDADGNVVDGIPSQAGTYTVEATFEGDSTFDACSASGTYTIERDVITLKVADSKVYDGTAAAITYKVDYDGEYTLSIHYTGTQYVGTGDISYDSSKAPVKPGEYTVELSAYDKATGELLATKSKSYKITYKITQTVNNNSDLYPGAQDYYNNKQIVIVGEGFTQSEQSEFEAAAKEYAEYILNTEPFKEVQSYFNFTTVETVSNSSGIGTTAKNTYFGVKYDKNGKIIVSSENAPSNIAYYNVSPYRQATIVIVNDSTHIKQGTVSSAVSTLYGGLDSASKAYVAKELLNILTGHDVGYTASTTTAKAAQRLELLSDMYYTWYGADYAVIAGNAYDKEFVSGTPVNLDGCFQTYILGKEVPSSELNYTYTYYDSEGNKLDSAPSKAGTYSVVAELVPPTDKYYAYDETYTKFWEVTDDQTINDDWEVLDADGNKIGDIFWYEVTGVTLDGQLYLIPQTRGTSTFTIYTANQLATKQFQAKKNTLSSVKSSAKKSLTATWTTVSGAAGYQVQYSTSSTFKTYKTVTVTGSSKKTTTIKSLTSNKKYYVRVRAYKTIGGKKVYSTWSTTKYVTVK